MDDHPLLRAGMVAALASHRDRFVVAAEADSVDLALERYRPISAAIDLAVIDINLPGRSGLELVAEIGADVPCLVISAYDAAAYTRLAIEAGARGYMEKKWCLTRLVRYLDEIAAGGAVFEALDSDMPLSELSSREMDVWSRLGQGARTDSIARELGISASTVDSYRARIREKLGIAQGQLAYHATCWRQSMAV